MSFHKSYWYCWPLVGWFCVWKDLSLAESLSWWIPKIPKVLISQELCHDRKPKDQNNNTTLIKVKVLQLYRIDCFYFPLWQQKINQLGAFMQFTWTNASIKQSKFPYLWKFCTIPRTKMAFARILSHFGHIIEPQQSQVLVTMAVEDVSFVSHSFYLMTPSPSLYSPLVRPGPHS